MVLITDAYGSEEGLVLRVFQKIGAKPKKSSHVFIPVEGLQFRRGHKVADRAVPDPWMLS